MNELILTKGKILCKEIPAQKKIGGLYVPEEKRKSYEALELVQQNFDKEDLMSAKVFNSKRTRVFVKEGTGVEISEVSEIYGPGKYKVFDEKDVLLIISE